MKKYIGKNIKALNILMIMACIGSSTANVNAWVDPSSKMALTNHELLQNIAYLLGISYTDVGVLTTTNTRNSTYEQIQEVQNNVDLVLSNVDSVQTNVDNNLRLVQNIITGATGNPEIGSLGFETPQTKRGQSILGSQNETNIAINNSDAEITTSINNSNQNINNNLQQVQNTITGASSDTRIGSLGLETPQTKKGQSIAGIQGTNTGDTLTSIAGEIAAVKTDVGTVKTELKADIDAAKTDVRADVDAAKTDVRSDIAGLKIDVETVKTTAGDVKSALTDTTAGSIRDDLTTVKTDVGTVKADLYTVKTTSGDVKSALTDTAAGSIRDDLTTVKTDVGTVKADLETVKTTAGDVKSALTDTTAGSIRDHLTTINDSTKVGGTLQSTMDSYQSSTGSTLSGIVASIGSPTMATTPGADGATVLGNQITMASDAATVSKKIGGNLDTIKRTTDKTAKSIASSPKKGLSSSNPKGSVKKVNNSKKLSKNIRRRL